MAATVDRNLLLISFLDLTEKLFLPKLQIGQGLCTGNPVLSSWAKQWQAPMGEQA